MNHQSVVIRWFSQKPEADAYAGKIAADHYAVDVAFTKYLNYSDSEGSLQNVWIVIGKK